jgi:drug/metabolite transporter (DMT)-like permease
MTVGVLLAVLCGALLHAGWNALIKRGSDKALDTAFVTVLSGVVALPAVVATGLPRPEAWPFLLGSMVIHIGYYTALVGAYRHGDLGLTYPVMRGLAPLLVACGSAALLGEALRPLAWLGVAAVSAGVVTMGLRLPGRAPAAATAGTTTADANGSHSARAAVAAAAQPGRALRWALFNALLIACYTVVDGLGVRRSGDTLAYLAALFVLDGLPYGLIILWQRRADLPAVAQALRRRGALALLAAGASVASYGIALWAMTRAPVALVAALRETSVLFAALIGWAWLREAFGPQRALATGLILAGVVLLRLA